MAHLPRCKAADSKKLLRRQTKMGGNRHAIGCRFHLLLLGRLILKLLQRQLKIRPLQRVRFRMNSVLQLVQRRSLA